MTDQLTLVDVHVEPSLTPRQARALELVTATGQAGIHADELGAQLHADYRKHDAQARCRWCGASGMSFLKALRRKGLVRYRRGNAQRPGFWQAIGAREERVLPVAYNQFPEGF